MKAPRSLCLSLVDDLWQVVAVESPDGPAIPLAPEPAGRSRGGKDPEHEHRGAQTRLRPDRRSIAGATGRDGDAEPGDEEHEKDTSDQRPRPRYGDGAGDGRMHPDRYRDLDPAGPRVRGLGGGCPARPDGFSGRVRPRSHRCWRALSRGHRRDREGARSREQQLEPAAACSWCGISALSCSTLAWTLLLAGCARAGTAQLPGRLPASRCAGPSTARL